MRAARHRDLALAGMLALVMLPAATAGGLPRVFLSPAERAAITAHRLSGRPLPAAETQPNAASAERLPLAGPTAPPPPAGAVPRPARIDGVTFGAGRQQAVWIAGQRIADGGVWSGNRVRVTRDGVQLIAADGSVRLLRVGMEVRP